MIYPITINIVLGLMLLKNKDQLLIACKMESTYMPLLNIGLIGIGHVAEAQIEAIQRVENVKLVTAHDIDQSKQASLPDDVEFFDSLDEFVKFKDVDLFLVSTPNLTHGPIGLKVLQAKRPLLLEKPASQNRVDLQELRELSESSGTYFSVALHASYAREVIWWKENQDSFNSDWGDITGFECGFYDPYIVNDSVLESAKGLGGSWFDSAINALSVIGLFINPNTLSIQDSYMTSPTNFECSQVQGSSVFTFRSGENGIGRGLIDTNWTLGLNRKVTRLFYGTTGYEVILHHSKEILRIERHGVTQFEKDFSGGNTRLSNHYTGLFKDHANRLSEGRSNIRYADAIHQLLFDAEEGRVLRKDG